MALFECPGAVVPGKRLGRTLGFPTANIRPDRPAPGVRGVYAGTLDFGEGPLRCVVDVGSHPTLPEGPPTIEAHIPGFSGDLYGKRVRLRLERFLRPERKFDSAQALVRQMKADVQAVLRGEEQSP